MSTPDVPNDAAEPTDADPGEPTSAAASTSGRDRMDRAIRRPVWRAIGAGLLLAASLPPWGWWPLAFVAIVVIDRLLADVGWRTRLLRGATVGWALFFPTTVWISQLTGPGYVFAALVFGAMVGLFCTVVPPGAGRAPALIGAWVLCESFRSAWPFGGVPLSLLAVGQVAGPLAGIARIGGVLAIAAATVAVGLVLSAALRRDGRGAAIAGAFVVALVAIAAIAPQGYDNGRTVDIALVQGGGEQGTRAISSDSREVFERHLEASQLVPEGMDLVLWPENVVDTRGDVQDSQEGRELEDLARQLDSPLSVGTVEGVSDTEFRNSQQMLDADGNWVDRYVKVQRVPFGEWVPFRSMIEAVAPDTLSARDATISTESGLLEVDDIGIATVISWEVFFGHRARSAVEAGGEIIYNPTNGSTYTGTFVQTQQVANSRLRAIESGRWLAQVSPTGFSEFVDPDGRVYQRTGTREQAVLVMEDVPLRSGFTWYTRHGDMPVRVGAVLLIVAGWALDRRWLSLDRLRSVRRPRP